MKDRVKHGLSGELSFSMLFYLVPVLLICTFIIDIGRYPALWQEVIKTVDRSWIIYYIAVAIAIITIIFITFAIVLFFTRDTDEGESGKIIEDSKK